MIAPGSSYLRPSRLDSRGSQTELELSTALAVTPGGFLPNPRFFSGLLARPDVVAAGLLAVADTAAAKYTDHTTATLLASLDPVVTGSGDRLRFEAFSGCNGVYVRLDLLAEALAGEPVGFGTTNVDINQPLRTALATLGRSDLMHLSVGRDELTVSTPRESHTEQKVNLPSRWVRGFAEIPALTRSMTERLRVPGAVAARFLSSLGRRVEGRPAGLLVLGGQLRQVAPGLAGALSVTGLGRVATAARVARFARELIVLTADNASTAWVFELPGARLTLVLSPEPYRGFSGEGTLLLRLADTEAVLLGRRLAAELGWQTSIEVSLLARSLGVAHDRAEAGLAWLSACGRVGYDLTEGSWFHRELPLDAAAVLRRSPRLRDALTLGAPIPCTCGRHWQVVGSRGDVYRVTSFAEPSTGAFGGASGGWDCTCEWSYRGGNRGPCKHILAVLLRADASDQ